MAYNPIATTYHTSLAFDDYDNESNQNKVGDFFKYGITSSVASGAMSFVNTAAAVGNWFGGNFEYRDTADVLSSLGLENTSNYYDENRGAMDMIGLVAGSFIPGVGGVRAAQALKRGVQASTSNSRIVLGLQRTVYPQSQSQRYAQRIMNEGTYPDKSYRYILDAAKEGFREQAIETAFAEAAIMLTMNQNPLIGSEDLDYFGAIKDNTGSMALGFFLGTGISGTIATAMGSNALRKMVRTELREVNDLSPSRVARPEFAVRGETAGDQLGKLAEDYHTTLANLEARQNGDVKASALVIAELQKRVEAHEKVAMEWINEATKPYRVGAKINADDASHLNTALYQVWKNTPDAAQVRERFGGLERATIMGEETVLMDSRLSPLTLLDEELSEAGVREFYQQAVGKFAKAENLTPDEVNTLVDRYVNSMYNAEGMTVPGLAWNNDASITAVWNDKDMSLARKVFVARHEIGHNQTDRLAKFWDSPIGELMKGEATALSRKARPQLWRDADYAREILELSPAELSARGIALDDLNKYRKTLDYAEMPEEILADAWAMLDSARDQVKTDSFLYKVFAQNGAAKANFGPKEAMLDLVVGDTYNTVQRVPTLRDLGEVKLVNRGKQVGFEVRHAQGVEKFKLTDAFDVSKETWQSASAKYFAARNDTSKLAEELTVEATNLPMMLQLLTRAQRTDGAALRSRISLQAADGTNYSLDLRNGVTEADINLLRREQLKAKNALLTEVRNRETGKFGELEMARILDMNDAGESINTLGVYMADAQGIQAITDPQVMRALSFSEVYDPNRPTMAKLMYQADRVSEADVTALADVEMRYRRNLELKSEQIDSFMASEFGERVKMPESTAISSKFKRNDAGEVTEADGVGGFLTAVQGNYDFISWVQQVGSTHRKALQLGMKKIVDTVRPAAEALKRSPAGLAEVAALDSFLRRGKFKELRNPRQYSENLKARAAQLEGEHGEKVREVIMNHIAPKMDELEVSGNAANLWSTKLEDAVEDLFTSPRVTSAKITRLEDLMTNEMKGVANSEVAELFRSSQTMRNTFAKADAQLAGFEGRQGFVDPDVWYPGPADMKRYKHVAFVVPKKNGIMANNSKSIIGAPTEEAFAIKQQQIRQKFGDDVRIVTPQDSTDYFRLKQEYDADLSFNEYNINSSLTNRGIFSDLAPEPTPQIVDHYVNALGNSWKKYNDGMFKHKYTEEVNILESLHQQKVSRQGTPASTAKRKASEVVSNPRKLLDIMFNNTNKDFESYIGMQEKFDKAFSAVANTIGQTVKNLVRPNKPVDFTELNGYLEQYGLPKVYNEEVRDYLVRTEAVNDRLLASWIPAVNGLASTFMLRLDLIQPIVNVLSVPILAHPEMRHLRAQLPELKRKQWDTSTSVQVPNSNERMPSSLHLQMQATKDWFNPEIRKRYEDLDLLGNMAREQREAIDLLTVSADTLKSKSFDMQGNIRKALGKAVNIASKPSDMSEEFSKFMASRMAELMLDAAGVVDQTLRAQTMRTFTTRIVGNYNAAQRPGLFQGSAGQLFGLFQTYQFNLIQQMLRHMGESPRRAAGMMGIQAGIFGAQSVPGFQILNSHIAEKSDWENDFFTGFNDTFGSSVGEWIVYGAASNLTRPVFGDGIELYTRGDLNPRTPVLIPTSLNEVPAISMATNFLGSMTNAANTIAEGAPVGGALLEALANNGMNRPLQGIMQLAQGARLTNRGTMLATTEDLNLAQRLMRVAGSRGLDESIAVNAFYRAQKYETARQENIRTMGAAARTAIRAGNYDSVMHYDFMNRYVEYGGNLDNFTSWMHNNAVNATESQLWQMSKQNNSTVGRYMQTLMGGEISSYIGSWHQQAYTPIIGKGQGQVRQAANTMQDRLNFNPANQ